MKQALNDIHPPVRLRPQPAYICMLIAVCLLIYTDLTRAAEGKTGGELVIAISSDIRSTNPGVNRDGNTDAVLYHIVESLVAFADDSSVKPLLAERIHISGDGRTYQFTLRKGVYFHNGTELKAEHVVWSWRRLLDPATGFRCLDWYDGQGNTGLRIEEIKATNDYQVEFQLNKASSLFLHRMANLQCLTGIVHPDSVNADGTWKRPVGTGPYSLGKWKRGEGVYLHRFRRYSSRSEARDGLTGNKTPYLDTLFFRITPDPTAAMAALFSGAVDLLFAVPPSARHSLADRAQRRGDIKLYDYLTLDWTTLLIQSDHPLLGKPTMRRAIAHALAHNQIAEFSTLGMAPANASAVQSISPYFNEKHTQWLDYNPQKARQLSLAAGYQGEELVLQTNRKYSYMFDNAIAIQAMLHAAGFNVRLQVLDWASQLSNFLKGEFQLSSFGYSARSHPALLFGTFTGDRGVSLNYQWDDPIARSLVAALENASEEETHKILDQLFTRYREQVPMIGLYNDHNTDVTRRRVKNYQPWAFGRPRLWGVWLDENLAGKPDP